MNTTQDIRLLARYTAWADTRLLDALQAVPTETLLRPQLVPLGGMLDILHHCLLIDQVWQAHLLQKPHGFASRIPQGSTTLAELRQRQAEIDAWYVAYADGLSATAHHELLDFDFIDGGSGTMSRGDMLLHVVNHKTYHRGCVAVLAELAGHRPPSTDLPVFLRDTASAHHP